MGVGANAFNRCANSDFFVTIFDPCLQTTLIPDGFPQVMRTPQLQTDSLDLSVVIPAAGGSWLWTNTVDMAISDAIYGDNRCGPVIFEVEPTSSLIQLVGTTLNFTPGTATPQEYQFILKGTLTRYGKEAVFPFVVEVLNCQAEIDTSAITLTNMVNDWSDPAQTQSFIGLTSLIV